MSFSKTVDKTNFNASEITIVNGGGDDNTTISIALDSADNVVPFGQTDVVTVVLSPAYS